jgi:hypothetical protein
MLVLQFEYLFAVAVEGVCRLNQRYGPALDTRLCRIRSAGLIGKMDICRQSAACARNSKRIFKTPRLRSEAKLITHHNSTRQRVFPFFTAKRGQIYCLISSTS